MLVVEPLYQQSFMHVCSYANVRLEHRSAIANKRKPRMVGTNGHRNPIPYELSSQDALKKAVHDVLGLPDMRDPDVDTLEKAYDNACFLINSNMYRTECPADRAMSPRLFADLFNALAAARRRWKDKPTAPRKVEDHCDLAKAIDKYNAEHSDCS
ncbi:hypothetical protein E8E14_014595 [Neopestalotiopsis sp. 37M]|nr:hypothetical protein E8E14_014595 [Neopestalotiopsis sp. 37M]